METLMNKVGTGSAIIFILLGTWKAIELVWTVENKAEKFLSRRKLVQSPRTLDVLVGRMNQTIDLRIPDLRKVPAGTIVISSKGFSFELISRDENGKESWLGVEAKLIWHDIAETNINHHQAMKKYKDQIPSREQFIEAENHGFREVLPNMEDYWFWSSTPYPGDEARYASVFNGYNGSAYGGDSRDDSHDDIAARCCEKYEEKK